MEFRYNVSVLSQFIQYYTINIYKKLKNEKFSSYILPDTCNNTINTNYHEKECN